MSFINYFMIQCITVFHSIHRKTLDKYIYMYVCLHIDINAIVFGLFLRVLIICSYCSTSKAKPHLCECHFVHHMIVSGGGGG